MKVACGAGQTGGVHPLYLRPRRDGNFGYLVDVTRHGQKRDTAHGLPSEISPKGFARRVSALPDIYA